MLTHSSILNYRHYLQSACRSAIVPCMSKLTDVPDRDRASHTPSFFEPLSDCHCPGLSTYPAPMCAPSALSQTTTLCPRSLREPRQLISRGPSASAPARSSTRHSAGRIIVANAPTTRRDPISPNRPALPVSFTLDNEHWHWVDTRYEAGTGGVDRWA